MWTSFIRFNTGIVPLRWMSVGIHRQPIDGLSVGRKRGETSVDVPGRYDVPSERRVRQIDNWEILLRSKCNGLCVQRHLAEKRPRWEKKKNFTV